jgi:hypothetical protein
VFILAPRVHFTIDIEAKAGMIGVSYSAEAVLEKHTGEVHGDGFERGNMAKAQLSLGIIAHY